MSPKVQPLLDALVRRTHRRQRSPRSAAMECFAAAVRTLRAGTRDVRMAGLRAAGWARASATIIRSLPEYNGTFELQLQSHITRAALAGAFEPDLAELMKLGVDPERDVVDVGAHCGLYTVLIGKAVAASQRVLAIEPAPAVLPMLHGNIVRNGLGGRVIVYEGVVTDKAGRVALSVQDGKDEYASITTPTHPNAPRARIRTVQVAAETLDRLVERHHLAPGFVKIDVEGAEGLALSGATRLLKRERPVLISELDDRLLAPLGWSSARVIELLAGHGYSTWDALSGVALGADVRKLRRGDRGSPPLNQ